jgi:3-oxoacyl-[acyl-carrier protein] reductase
VVVTGGTRGIGWAITQKLIANDYYPIVIARSPPQNSICSEFISWDLSKTDTLKELSIKLRERFEIYGLVNNAGIGTAGILSMMPDSQIAHVLHMNVVAPITLTKYLLRPMMTSRAGRIINISSIVANTGYQGLSAYAASKAALVGFTHSLAREVGPLGITVNAIAPGFVSTEMTHGLDEKHRQQIAKRSALQRMAGADDVANSVLFLLSDAASNITGTVLTVDAGNTA